MDLSTADPGFWPLENEFKPMADVQFSLDLALAAKREWHFMKSIDEYGGRLYDTEILKNAIRRYEQCWLEDLAQHSSNPDHLPPMDIRFVWHTHTLSPIAYRRDCERMANGNLIDHRLLSTQDVLSRQEASQDHWKSHYPTEPYNAINSLRPSIVAVSQQSIPYDQKSSIELVRIAQMQREFHFQVALPHYCSSRFLNRAVERYKKFLQLQMQRPNELLWPSNDVHLVWRSHMAHPSHYASDMFKIFGKVLPYEQELSHVQIRRAVELTEQLWNAQFPNDLYHKRGTQPRPYASPCSLNLKSPSPDDHRRGKLHISSVNLSNLRSTDRGLIDVRLFYDDRLVLHVAPNGQSIIGDPQRPSCKVDWSTGKSKGALAKIPFVYDRKQMKHLKLKLEQKSSEDRRRIVIGSKSDHHSAKVQAIYPLEEFLDFWITDSNSDDERPRAVGMRVEGPLDGRMVRADCRVEAMVTLKSRFRLTPGHFVGHKLANGQWLSDLVKTLTRGGGEERIEVCMASHWLNDLKHDAQYTVDVVHLTSSSNRNPRHPRSVIVVRDRRQRPLVVAHLLDPGALPEADDLEERVPMPTPHVGDERNEKFVNVVNRNGDFAMIKGTRKGDLGDQGAVRVEFFNLASGSMEIVQVPNVRGKTEIKIAAITADLKTSQIECYSIHVAEYIASVFSVALLVNLCSKSASQEKSRSMIKSSSLPDWSLLTAVAGPNLLEMGQMEKDARLQLPDEFAGL